MIIKSALIIFRENIMVVIHLLTINDVVFYGFASFKIQAYYLSTIDPIKMAFSVLMMAYYLLYLLRLVIAACRYTGSE